MLLRLRVGKVPHIAAFLLLLGIVLGGSVDAIACEPAAEMDAVTAMAADAHASDDSGTPDEAPAKARHGECIHGHCHHGAQQVPSLVAQVDPPTVSVTHPVSGESVLVSLPPGSLKRPPRA